MRKIIVISLLFLFLTTVFILPSVTASSIIEESGKLYIVYPNLPNTIQTVLNKYCIQYQNNRLVGDFGVDSGKYQAFVQCSGKYYPFSKVISELNSASSIIQGERLESVREAEVIGNFAKLMTKYMALLIEKEGFPDSKLVISKPLKFDDDPRFPPGELVGGTVECTGKTCFLGAVIDDMSYYQAGFQSASITFIDRRERKINFLADNSRIVVYLTEDKFNKDEIYKTIARSTASQLLYYKALVQDDATYYHVVKGTFNSNGVPKKNEIMELLTMTLGCAVPSIKYPEGFEVRQISQKVGDKDYFTLGNYPKFYCILH